MSCSAPAVLPGCFLALKPPGLHGVRRGVKGRKGQAHRASVRWLLFVRRPSRPAASSPVRAPGRAIRYWRCPRSCSRSPLPPARPALAAVGPLPTCCRSPGLSPCCSSPPGALIGRRARVSGRLPGGAGPYRSRGAGRRRRCPVRMFFGTGRSAAVTLTVVPAWPWRYCSMCGGTHRWPAGFLRGGAEPECGRTSAALLVGVIHERTIGRTRRWAKRGAPAPDRANSRR